MGLAGAETGVTRNSVPQVSFSHKACKKELSCNCTNLTSKSLRRTAIWCGVFLESMPDCWGKTLMKRRAAQLAKEAGAPEFPSKNDDFDKGAWEYLLYRLAVQAGVSMSESNLLQVSGPYRTFLTKRFDRQGHNRIHFASAMTMTGNTENTLKDRPASYLDVAEFIQFSGASPREDLHQLWRRIVFNIAVSNTDDHLRNHGFLLAPSGWRLSPAFDMNPIAEKDGLSLNINMDDNALDFDLAFSVGKYFQLTVNAMHLILDEVKTAVRNWRNFAVEIQIPRQEQERLASAFR